MTDSFRWLVARTPPRDRRALALAWCRALGATLPPGDPRTRMLLGILADAHVGHDDPGALHRCQVRAGALRTLREPPWVTWARTAVRYACERRLADDPRWLVGVDLAARQVAAALSGPDPAAQFRAVERVDLAHRQALSTTILAAWTAA